MSIDVQESMSKSVYPSGFVQRSMSKEVCPIRYVQGSMFESMSKVYSKGLENMSKLVGVMSNEK